MKVTIDGVEYVPRETFAKKSIADELEKMKPAVEWDSKVEAIQKWYYGLYVKASWCATTVSYIINKLGLTDVKSDNVYTLMVKLRNSNTGTFYNAEQLKTIDIKKDDILFFLWAGNKMVETSSKHVSVAYLDNKAGSKTVFAIGGNQKDKICTLEYERSKIYGMFRFT